MARFSSSEEAQKELNIANNTITDLLKEDLKDITHNSLSIDLWLNRYGGDNNYQEKKNSLINYEMLKTDAELYIEFSRTENGQVNL